MKKRFPVLVWFAASVALSFCALGAVAEGLPAPTIAVSPDIYYPQDEALYLEGRSLPNTTLQVQFQKSGGKPLRLVVRSDATGEWVLAERIPLEAGEWEVRARILESTGTSSPWSNPRIIRASITGVTIGGITVKFSALLLPLLAAVAAVAYLIYRLRREAREKAGALIEQEFSGLRQDLEEELRHLERRGTLSREEAEHRDRLLRELGRIEKDVERKVREL